MKSKRLEVKKYFIKRREMLENIDPKGPIKFPCWLKECEYRSGIVDC